MIRGALPALAVLLALSACGGEEPDQSPVPSETPSATTPSAPIVLSFGDEESVVWQPTADLEAALAIKVQAVREGDPADFEGLEGSGITEENQPYYVDVTITNEGTEELGGLDVPLYLQDSAGTLAPPWGFANRFKRCPSGPLPDSFGTGDDVERCLVFFASPAASFDAITFWPEAEAQPVSWMGEVKTLAERGKSKTRGKRSKQRR